MKKIEKGAIQAYIASTIQQITNNKLIKATKQGQKRRFNKAQGFGHVIGVEVLMQRQADFIQRVIDSVWKSDFGHLGPELFMSPKKKKPIKSPRKKGPTQQVWLVVTKDFRLIEADIFTMDTGLGLPSPSPIQARKRKAKDQGKELVKRCHKATKLVVSELDELLII